jgi:hypothetical protein
LPKAHGRHATTSKDILPMAPMANAERFTDAVKVEKWFKRNCSDVPKRASHWKSALGPAATSIHGKAYGILRPAFRHWASEPRLAIGGEPRTLDAAQRRESPATLASV